MTNKAASEEEEGSGGEAKDFPRLTKYDDKGKNK